MPGTHIVMEDDVALRPFAVLLDPECPPERRAAFADYVGHDLPHFEVWRESLRAEVPGLHPCRVTLVSDEAELRAALSDADAVIVEALPLGEAELDAGPRLRLVQKFGAVVSNIDLDACAKRGVPVAIQRRRTNIAVAEHGFMLLLAIAKRLPLIGGLVTPERFAAIGRPLTPFDRRHTPNANWGRISGLQRLNGARLGLIGFGEIARETALIARGFGMDVVYHQRTRQDSATEADFGVRYGSFEEVMACEAVSVQLPFNAATRGFVDARALALMPEGAILINTARAEIVDRTALVAALNSGRLAGAGFDVLYDEPGKEGDPLLDHPDFLSTPHLAGGSRLNGLADMREMITGMHARLAG